MLLPFLNINFTPVHDTFWVKNNLSLNFIIAFENLLKFTFV
ncbi:hypothetical protein SAMN05660477_02483 [Soonwooa buanensis]|uniref:Uncharacterized protein n=1 Tax=Soonwooa buanensis TaxID=619805 RepID=A0A1T5G1Z8_9FLAO|nr:hypothetical protein SAMN05660477_02483 [Soonwooa buanensis]